MIYETPPSDFNKRFDIVGCFVEHDGRFLILKRQPHKANGGKWGLPAGKRDKGESMEEAVLREIEEETGLKLSASSVRYFRSVPVRDGSFDIDWHMFSTKLDNQPGIIINPHEHSEFLWATPEEVLKMDDLIHDLDGSIEMFYGKNN